MILFFDTETTGVPLNYNASHTDTDNWPRLVEIAWALVTENDGSFTAARHIIRPDGFEIPVDAAHVHGVTTEKAKRVGIEILGPLTLFAFAVKVSDVLVGHNINFDKKIVEAEYHRLGKIPPTLSKPSLCTMLTSINHCQIPGPYGLKYPKLHKLYELLFGEKFEGAHSALYDVLATKKCFFELVKLGVIEWPKDSKESIKEANIHDVNKT